MFENNSVNKKHKGIKNYSPAMDFENFANRIVSLNNCDTFIKPPADFKEVSRLTLADGETQQEKVVKTKFSQFNDKRFYFSGGITSLPVVSIQVVFSIWISIISKQTNADYKQ